MPLISTMELTMDCYAILEVPEGASLETVRAAHRRLAQEWHPDKNPDKRAEANRKMAQINRAWEILKAREASSHAVVRTSLYRGITVPELLEVNSGCVRSVGHNGRLDLFVEFRTGGLYVYHGVTGTTYQSLLHSKAKGRFVMYHIVTGPYTCKRIAA